MTLLDEWGTSPASPWSLEAALQRVELRHLRYFVAVAEAGTFTGAAERAFVAQPTLSQQVRRLEQMVGAQLLHRRRDGVGLTAAGLVLLDEARSVLSRVGHGLQRTRHAASVGRHQLRVHVPPQYPESLLVRATSTLVALAQEVDVDVSWVELPPDSEFSAVTRRHADASFGWLSKAEEELPETLDVMTFGEFEPEIWVAGRPSPSPEAAPISLDELAGMHVFHGPREQAPAVYDTWAAALATRRAGFAFKDPPFRSRWAATLASAGESDRAHAILTGPEHALGKFRPRMLGEFGPVASSARIAAQADGESLTGTAALAWSTDLPRSLQQLLFDVAETVSRSIIGASIGVS